MELDFLVSFVSSPSSSLSSYSCCSSSSSIVAELVVAFAVIVALVKTTGEASKLSGSDRVNGQPKLLFVIYFAHW